MPGRRHFIAAPELMTGNLARRRGRGNNSSVRRRPIKMPIAVAPILCLAALHASEDAVNPGELRAELPTFRNLGFEWPIGGDENRNASVAVEFRRVGERRFRQALPLLRVGDEQAGTPELAYVTPRLFAGSILDLEPDTAYECRFRMSDPDGVAGAAERTITLRTRAEPKASSGGRVRHVYPRGWKGTKSEPAYAGLLAAYYGYKRYADWNLTGPDPIAPGDIILVHAGEYKAEFRDYRDHVGVTFFGTYELARDGTAERPIVIRAAGDGEVVFDGNGAHRLFDVSAADHHMFEGLTFRNANVAIHAGAKNVNGPIGLVVSRCRFEDVGIGVHNEFAGSKSFAIVDNTFIGRHDRTKLVKTEVDAAGREFQHIRSYYAVKVAGEGHVIAHNAASYFFDGFDVSTYGRPDQDGRSVAIDITDNDVFAAVDNCFEGDGGVHNIRVMRNRCINSAQQPYSFQPILGGPAYVVRNVAYHTPGSESVKVWGMRGAGLLVYHNTFTSVPSRHDQGGSNVHFRNNIFLTQTNPHVALLAVKTYTAYSSFDYDGFRITKTSGVPFFWHGPQPGVLRDYELAHAPQEFPSFDAFKQGTGQERHGITVDYRDLVNVPEPSNEALPGPGLAWAVVQPTGLDFRLRRTSSAVDAGVRLPNVNDDFAGKAPDLGAFELGRPLPAYGPRLAR